MLKHWPLERTARFRIGGALGQFSSGRRRIAPDPVGHQPADPQPRGILEQPLFFRTGRSVTLTDAGHDLFSTAQVMLQQLAVGIRRLDQYRKPNQLIVNTTPAFARHWLMPRLGDFNRQHPQVDLWLFTSFEPPNMATDSIDLAIRDDLSAQADCTFNVLCSDRLYPACHPSLLALAAEQRVTLHGEREMDWSHWTVAGGAHVGQRDSGLNFSDPGLLLDAASPGWASRWSANCWRSKRATPGCCNR